MQTYDVEQTDLYKIVSQKGLTYNIGLMPGESVVGLGGVQVIQTGRRLIITSGLPTAHLWGYRIDYDAEGNVLYPVTPAELGKLIKDLTDIGCYEYTPDLLRTIKQRKEELLPFEVDHRLRI